MPLRSEFPEDLSPVQQSFWNFVRSSTLMAREGLSVDEVFSSPHSVIGLVIQRSDEVRDLVQSLLSEVKTWGETALNSSFDPRSLSLMIQWGVLHPGVLDQLIKAITLHIHELEMISLGKGLSRNMYLEHFFDFLQDQAPAVPWKPLFKVKFLPRIQEILSRIAPEPLRDQKPLSRQLAAVQKAKNHLNSFGGPEFYPDWAEPDLRWTFLFLCAIEEGMHHEVKLSSARELGNQNIELRLHLDPIDWSNTTRADLELMERTVEEYDLDNDPYDLGLEDWNKGGEEDEEAA